MRFPSSLFALNPSLLLWTFIALSSHVNASSHDLSRIPQHPFGIYQHTSHIANGRSWLSRIRDQAIEKIWRIPSEHKRGKIDCGTSTTSGPPSTLVARYGGDLVLRFEIRSTEEAQALAEAISVLFLDVWEFTTEWVDIRLSKDVVSSVDGQERDQSFADVSSLRSLHCWDCCHPRSKTLILP